MSKPPLGRRLLAFNLTGRLSLLTQITATAALAWLTPGSSTARLLEDGGHAGHVTLLALSLAAAAGWVDVLLSDLAGRDWLAALRRNEHFGFLYVGALYWLLAWVGMAADEEGVSVLLVLYLQTGINCCHYGVVSAVRGKRNA